MSKLYGKIPVSARKTAASARAHSRLVTIAASWFGSIKVELEHFPAEFAKVADGTHKNGRPKFKSVQTTLEHVKYTVTMEPWHEAGASRVIETGSLYEKDLWSAVSSHGAFCGTAHHAELAKLLEDARYGK
jgi:hypothetical protein